MAGSRPLPRHIQSCEHTQRIFTGRAEAIVNGAAGGAVPAAGREVLVGLERCSAVTRAEHGWPVLRGAYVDEAGCWRGRADSVGLRPVEQVATS